MIPHRLTFRRIVLSILLICSCSTIHGQKRKPPQGGRLAIVIDDRLAALRSTPQLSGSLIRRLGRGRLIAVRGKRLSKDGTAFVLVNVTSRTHGWIQRDALVSPSQPGDDRRLLSNIESSKDFERISLSRIFLDYFPRSRLRARVLLLIGDTAEEVAVKLSSNASKQFSKRINDVSEMSSYLNYSGLDRYNRQGVKFVFAARSKRLHYDGWAWREILRRHRQSAELAEAQKRLEELESRMQ